MSVPGDDCDDRDDRDALTGLLGEVAWLVGVAGVPGPKLVASFDVCGLRSVNADVGHDAGDRVLRAVARRLEQALPAGPLARCHGDLFLWAGPLGPLTAEAAAGVLRDALAAAQRPVEALDRQGRPVDVPVLLCGGGVLADAALGVPVPPGAAVATSANVPDARALLHLASFARAQGHAPGTVGLLSVSRHPAGGG